MPANPLDLLSRSSAPIAWGVAPASPLAGTNGRGSAAEEEDRLLARLTDDVARDRSECRRLRRIVARMRVRLSQVRVELRLARASADQARLTGLPDRRAPDLAVRLPGADGSEGSRPGAVLVLDLDDLQPVEDRRRRAAGDAVLRSMVERLRHAVRRDDRVLVHGR